PWTARRRRVRLDSGQCLLEQGQGYRVRKQYEVIGIRAGYSNTAWIDFITTDDQCGGVHFKLAERLWGSILTMKRANVSQEPLIARTRDGPTRERPGLGMGARLAGVRYVPDFLDRPPSRAVSTPMRRTRSPCCARAASGHAAALPSAASNSRRPMVTVIRPSRARCVRARYHATSVQSSRSRRAGCWLLPPLSSASTALLPPPAFCECRHRGLARRGIARRLIRSPRRREQPRKGAIRLAHP